MDEVDFAFVGKDSKTLENTLIINQYVKRRPYTAKYERTIYSQCSRLLLACRSSQDKTEAKCLSLISKVETVFHFLVEEGTKRGFDVDSILEIPSIDGTTCFSYASGFSEKISKTIIERGVKINNIRANMETPEFNFPSLAVPMMIRGLNPYVITNDGKNQIDKSPLSFVSEEAKKLLIQCSRSIHFSIDDIDCSNSCANDCPSNYRRFYFKNGEFVKMSNSNQIGRGGFGNVFKGSFHGEDKAIKDTEFISASRHGLKLHYGSM